MMQDDTRLPAQAPTSPPARSRKRRKKARRELPPATDMQVGYIEELAERYGLENGRAALIRAANQGRTMHPATRAATVARAWDAGRQTVSALNIREAHHLIRCLLHAAALDDPPLGIYQGTPENRVQRPQLGAEWDERGPRG